ATAPVVCRIIRPSPWLKITSSSMPSGKTHSARLVKSSKISKFSPICPSSATLATTKVAKIPRTTSTAAITAYIMAFTVATMARFCVAIYVFVCTPKRYSVVTTMTAWMSNTGIAKLSTPVRKSVGGNGSCCSGGCEFVLNVISSVHPMDRKKKTPVVHHTERVVNSLVSSERKVLRSIGVLSTWRFSMVLHGITGQIHKGIFQGGTLER